MKRNFVYSPPMVFVAIVLFFAGCNKSKPKDFNSASVEKRKIVIIEKSPCGCYSGGDKLNPSAIIFTDDVHVNFKLDSSKFTTVGNSSYIPLNVAVNYGDADVHVNSFVNEFPGFILTVKSKIEEQTGRKIKNWKYEDICSGLDRVHKTILFGIWIDYEDTENPIQPKTFTKSAN
jgi:hypothetical protein